MIARLTGTIIYRIKNPMIVDVHGVGYAVSVPEGLLGSIKENQTVTLYTYTHVREDTLQLFGFADMADLSLFELLLTVSGIGPKTALGVMNRGTDAIKRAIQKGDTDFFTAVPRLGKKNAQKIIIELRTKLGSLGEFDVTGAEGGETHQISEALLSMGFEKKEIREVIKKLSATGTIEEKIKQALRLMSR